MQSSLRKLCTMWMRSFLLCGTEFRIQIAERILGKYFYVQSVPDSVLYMNYFREFDDERFLYHKKKKTKDRDGTRIILMKVLLDYVYHLPGNYAELGTYQGNSARIIWNCKSQHAQLHCFDTFQGFHAEDIQTEKLKSGIAVKEGHFSDTSLNLVKKNILGRVDGDPCLLLHSGKFPETFTGHENLKNKQWKFVHLDCDLFKPTRAGLECFYPQMVVGGIMLVHDYNGRYHGVKMAVDEFAQAQSLHVIPLPDKVGSAVLVKTR